MNVRSMVVCVLLALLQQAAQAAAATDNAADPAYSAGLTNGSNGGTGFGPWVRADSAFYGAFIGSAGGNGGSSIIDTSGFAFGLNAKGTATGSNNISHLIRQFTQGPLQAGQVFTVDLDMGTTNTNEFSLATWSGSGSVGQGPTVMNLASQYYVMNSLSDFFNGGPLFPTGIPVGEAARLTYTVGQNFSYALTLSSLNSPTTYTLNGTAGGFNALYAEVDASSSSDANGAMYMNNIGIDVSSASTPEPGLLALVSLSLVALLRRR